MYFKVQLYQGGTPDPDRPREVIAETFLLTAERVAGERLVDRGVIQNYRAKV